MNNREAHFYLEELQSMMTQHRGIFSEEFVCANGMAIQALERIQSVDAVPVIRCKECKNWDTEWQNDWAKNYHYCPLIDGTRNGDWYCADAERREE